MSGTAVRPHRETTRVHGPPRARRARCDPSDRRPASVEPGSVPPARPDVEGPSQGGPHVVSGIRRPDRGGAAADPRRHAIDHPGRPPRMGAGHPRRPRRRLGRRVLGARRGGRRDRRDRHRPRVLGGPRGGRLHGDGGAVRVADRHPRRLQLHPGSRRRAPARDRGGRPARRRGPPGPRLAHAARADRDPQGPLGRDRRRDLQGPDDPVLRLARDGGRASGRRLHQGHGEGPALVRPVCLDARDAPVVGRALPGRPRRGDGLHAAVVRGPRVRRGVRVAGHRLDRGLPPPPERPRRVRPLGGRLPSVDLPRGPPRVPRLRPGRRRRRRRRGVVGRAHDVLRGRGPPAVHPPGGVPVPPPGELHVALPEATTRRTRRQASTSSRSPTSTRGTRARSSPPATCSA